MITTCKNCKYYTPKDNLHGDCTSDKFYASYHHKFEEYDKIDSKSMTPDCINVECDEGWGFVVGRDFGCIHFAYKNNDFQFVKSLIDEQRKLNRIQSVNNFLAELINKDPDFPLEIAKRLDYNPLYTKNTDIEFNNNEFIEKQKYHDFVYETMVQLQTDQIDFAKAIQKLQDYKTY